MVVLYPLNLKGWGEGRQEVGSRGVRSKERKGWGERENIPGFPQVFCHQKTCDFKTTALYMI